MIYGAVVKYSPVGEYLRLLILKRLAHSSPAKVEEIDQMVREAVEHLGMRYDWQIWPKLLAREVEIRNGIVVLTPYGRWILEQTYEEVARYIQKWLGISP